MNRRDVLTAGAGAALTALATPALASRSGRGGGKKSSPQRGAFRLQYAPHFGTFAEHAPGLLDQLRFGADQGFSAWEDNGLARRPVAEQEAIGREIDRLGMQLGTFIAHVERERPTFASGRPEARERIARDLQLAAEVARRTGARFCTVVPGARDPGADEATQTRRCLDNLRRAADLCARNDLVMVIEPVHDRGLFLRNDIQAFKLCRAVGSPACQMLLDVYARPAGYQQATFGAMVCGSQIGYVQMTECSEHWTPLEMGAVTTGPDGVLQVLLDRGYRGLVGLDHRTPGAGRAGERTLLARYRQLDAGLQPRSPRVAAGYRLADRKLAARRDQV